MPFYPFEFGVMGCPAQILLEAPRHAEAKQAHQFAKSFLQDFEYKYSRYRDDSVVSAINQSRVEAPYLVDEQTAAMINFAFTMYVESDGLFDITSGVLRRVWDFKSEVIPNQQQIDEVLPLVGLDKIFWQAPYIGLPAGMELDFGGFAKEYTADACANAVHERFPGLAGLVNLGGDVAIFGKRDKPWRVGVETPPQADLQMIMKLASGGVATSGDNARKIVIDDKKYCHILNPKTGWPVQSLYSVTVVAPSCVVAGAITTIAMLKGEREGVAWLAAQQVPHIWFDQTFQCGGEFGRVIGPQR